jgi:hypothetical protein
MRPPLRAWLVLLVVGLLSGALLAAADDAPRGNPPPPRDGGGPRAEGGGDQRGPGGPAGGFHLIPRFAEEKLNLTEDQKKQVADLEAETKAKLEKILTPEQIKTLQEARPPRRGGPGAGGPGGPDGGQRRPGGDAPEGQRRPGGGAPEGERPPRPSN